MAILKMTTNSSDYSDNGNNGQANSNRIIELKQSERLKQSGLVTKSVYYIYTNDVKISLNHNSGDNIIFTIDRKKWQNNLYTIAQQAEEIGIHNEDSKKLLKFHLNDNHDSIIESNHNNTNTGQRNDENEEEWKSLPQILVELVLENYIKLLKDEFNIPHIIVEINNIYHTIPINSTKFKRYLFRLYRNSSEGRIANTEAINSAISQLEAIAEFEGATISLHLRVAWENPDTADNIYYDLSDEKNRYVKVTKDRWEIVENQIDVLFRKYNHLKPQVEPISTFVAGMDGMDSKDSKMFNEFMSLFNLKTNKENIEDIKLLLKCYIISLFIPDIQKPILLLHGEQGGAKSTFQELIKMLVDPSIITTLTFPRDSNEFIQQLSHNYIAYYDNVSIIQDWISDLICRAVTGNSSTKRALWTNDDDFYYNFKRIIGINGIDLAATKADLLDRSIIIELERINKKNRKKIKKIWEQFNRLKPYVLGYIFDILAKVLRYKEEHGEIEFPDGQNRMADWEEYAEIISRCMGNPDWEFQRVYQDNIGIQIDEAIESSPLSQTIMEFMTEEIVIGLDAETKKEIKSTRGDEWKGTSTELHTTLQNIAIDKLNLNVSRSKLWPKSAGALTRKINGVKTNLREKGYEITIGKENGKRYITISKISSKPSKPPKPPESSTKQEENLDSNLNNVKISSIIPSTENSQKQAQNPTLDSKDSMDDTLQTTNVKEQESILQSIHRKSPNSDIWECNHCNWTGDIWFMKKHPCKFNNKKGE
jgi:hypothetical protein